MIVWSCSNIIASMVQNINKEVINIENNARVLALFGEHFYEHEKNFIFLEKSVKRIFENNPLSLGGGIWFKPYLIDKSKKFACIYAYRTKDNDIIIDKTFETNEYNYLNQNWYKEIITAVDNKNKIEWSYPYYEKEGSNTLMVTAGMGMYVDGKMIGITTVDWKISDILKNISEMKITANSFALFANARKDYILVSTDPFLNNTNLLGKSLKNIPWYNSNLKKVRYIHYHGKKYVPYVKALDNGMIIVICVPKNELFYLIGEHVIKLFLLFIGFCFIIAGLLYMGLNNNILKPINKLIEIANKIGQGNSGVEIKLEKPEEFSKLASVYNQMTQNIKTITKEREHINSELAIAKSIQESSLPNVFPPFPNRKDFDIYASMTPAKDVGGDFYDFYFIDENTFMFLIADVSGKGIPASLFMMTAKTLINNYSQLKLSAKDLITLINKKICENNKNGLFITMFACIVDIRTGKLTCINCGHNPPLIKKSNGKFEYLKLDSNIVLGAFDDFEFKLYESELNKGDIIFAYTDGITEATNEKQELYGEDRLYNNINAYKDYANIKDIADSVKKDVTKYSEGISDDITMVIFRYNGCEDFKTTFKTDAKLEYYKDFYNWLHQTCRDWNFDDEFINKLDMCAEELYANITFYAYPNNDGTIEVCIEKFDNALTMKFTDSGVPYNPLEKPDPDIDLPPEDRPLGGLGIFMLKQMADVIVYDRIDDTNNLKLTFSLEEFK
jgi:sigma-B regulation protein RsbU (phosphoserine phosphatase)